MEALSSAVTGLGTFQQALNVVGSNLANVSTPGYKATTISFQELIASVSRPASGPTSTLGGINPHQSVQGVKVGQENAKYTQGSLTPTGKPTDLGITGDGFFVLRQVNGNLAYTRNGNFSIDKTGLFVNASGFPVMGWTADATGNVDTAQPVGKLTIPLGLSKSLVTKNISRGARRQHAPARNGKRLVHGGGPRLGGGGGRRGELPERRLGRQQRYQAHGQLHLHEGHQQRGSRRCVEHDRERSHRWWSLDGNQHQRHRHSHHLRRGRQGLAGERCGGPDPQRGGG
ncbi:MAG: flagellar hook basal-body protein [Proteobacteria bacterium]|nr:flagellar hook basal-body protein [Pseudomonadota bacterium]